LKGGICRKKKRLGEERTHWKTKNNQLGTGNKETGHLGRKKRVTSKAGGRKRGPGNHRQRSVGLGVGGTLLSVAVREGVNKRYGQKHLTSTSVEKKKKKTKTKRCSPGKLTFTNSENRKNSREGPTKKRGRQARVGGTERTASVNEKMRKKKPRGVGLTGTDDGR